MRVSTACRLALLAAVIALPSASASTSAADAGECTASAKFADTYASVQQQKAACEAASGVPLLEVPLSAKQKLLLCDKCPELAALAKAKTLPKCTITQANGQSLTLRQQFNMLFSKCTGDASGSESGSEATTTKAPVMTKPTTTPIATSTPTSTTKKSSSSSSSATPTPANDSVAGDADTGGSRATTISGKTASSPSTAASNTTSNTGSKKDASLQTAESDSGSSLSISLIAGIVVGVIGVAVVCAYFIVARRRRRDLSKSEDTEKFDDAMPHSSRELALDIPFHNAMYTADFHTNPNDSFHDNGAEYNPDQIPIILQDAVPVGPQSSKAPITKLHLWDDPLIVAARIPKDKVVATSLLSRGGFGEVYRGMYNHQLVAIKTLLPETRKDLVEINLFLTEIKLMARFEHEHIVQFIGVAWDSLTDLCVVTEFMEGGDLREVLTGFQRIGRLQGFDQDKVKIALHIAHALTYLHSLRPQVLHRDLKSKNILLDTQLNAKLTDFGVSRERSESTMTAGVGTSLWMAPEVMLGRRYDHKADIFSFGVVLSELDSHALPYSQAKSGSRLSRPVPDSAVLKLIFLGQLSVEFSDAAPPELVAIVKACVAYSPADRPSASDVLYMLHSVLRELHMSVSF